MANPQGKGWFRTRTQNKGEFLYFCWYSQDPGTGKRTEKIHKLGSVSEFPDEATRWGEVGRLGLTQFIDNPISTLTFSELVSRYIASGAISQKTLAKTKASGTVYVIRHNLESYCLPRWGTTVVNEIKPKALEAWLIYLHQTRKLAWTTVSGKVKQAMQSAFKFGRKEGILPGEFDPFRDIDCDASSDYEAITCTPEQTLAILNQLDPPEFILTLLIAATGLSISEALGLQWADVEDERSRIVVRRSWVGEIGTCKNLYRKAPVAMHPVLSEYLGRWQKESLYARPTDWVFASTKLKGVKPRCGSIASRRYLYPSAVKVGVLQTVEERDGSGRVRTRYVDLAGRPVRRWGWHNLRHSLASWLVSSGIDVKTVSSMLRHSNVRTTLGIYSHAVDSNKLAAQGQFLNTLLAGGSVQ